MELVEFDVQVVKATGRRNHTSVWECCRGSLWGDGMVIVKVRALGNPGSYKTPGSGGGEA